MIRVAILGQPFAAARIARTLNAGVTDIHAVFIPLKGYGRFLARPTGSDRLVIMRTGYRVGSRTPRGRLFDAYWGFLRASHRSAVRFHYWMGSDVMRTLDEFQTGRLRSAALSSVQDDIHLAVAPWLTAELSTIGLNATTALLPPPLHVPEVPPPLPTEFGVLSYLPTDRFAFYGGPSLMEVARRMPHVRFDVVANRGESISSPPTNVHWHGWVADMSERYAGATAVVRIPAHDGFGKTVIEGLLNARHVVYTHDVPFVRKVWPVTDDALAAELDDLYRLHVSGGLTSNLEGRAHALKEFDLVMLGDRLKALIRASA